MKESILSPREHRAAALLTALAALALLLHRAAPAPPPWRTHPVALNAAEPAELGAGTGPEGSAYTYELSEEGAVMLQMDGLLEETAKEFPSASQCYDLWLEGNLDACVEALQNAGADLPENFTAEVEARWFNTPVGRAAGRAVYWGSGWGWWSRLFRPPPCQWAWLFWGVFC